MEVRVGYKKTEIGIIPLDWNFNEINEYIDLLTGFPFPSAKYSSDGIRLLKGANVKRGETDWQDKLVTYWNEDINKYKNFELQADDLVIAMDGSLVGKSYALLTELDLPALLLQRVARIRSKKIDIRYLKYFVGNDWFVKYCDSVKTVTAIPHISPKDIRSFRIPLPPTLKEQTAIATALSDTDAWINSLEQLLTKKRQIKQGAMQELLQPKKGWEVSTIKQVANFRRGSFPQPYGLDKWYDDYNGMPFVQVYDVDDNKKLKVDTKRKISIAGSKFSVFVEKGSVIITIQGSIGRIAITQYDAYVDRTLLIFESFNVKFDKYFFVTMIELLFEKEKEKAPGGIIKTITKEALSSFEITYPDFEEQTRIATILSDMDEEIGQLETKLEKAKQLKQGMMQELLTGRIRLV